MPRVLVAFAALVLLAWLALSFLRGHGTPAPGDEALDPPAPAPPQETASRLPSVEPGQSLPGEALMDGYGDPSRPPIEDLRQLQRVILGYFSVVKDTTRYPIGGNADLTACLLGENADRQHFLRPDHPAIREGSELQDRWDTPLFVHPEAARELTLRSAGPDRAMFTADDLVLLPNGMVSEDDAPAPGDP